MILGVLGGMGPLATAAFYANLIAATPATSDQDHLHVVIDSNPTVPDRTSYLLGRGPDPRPALVQSSSRLRALGAGLLVMPCNTASAFRTDIEAAVGIPVFDWIAAATDGLAEREVRRVGLLATDGTLKTRLYHDAAEARGMECITPSDEDQASLMRIIYDEIKAGRMTAALLRDLVLTASNLSRLGADALVLGCTELPLALGAGDARWPIPVVDPSVEAARRIVQICTTNDGTA